jgi:fructosamine-3-kinase
MPTPLLIKLGFVAHSTLMMKKVIAHLEQSLSIDILQVTSLSGGDINDVFLLKTASETFVLKTNSASKFPGMFEAEEKGLKLLQNTQTFFVPKVINRGCVNDKAYLVLEHIDSKTPTTNFWETFGHSLAELHKNTAASFGLDHDNYIGSLSQYNAHRESASVFYIEQRLLPQWKLAYDKGFRLGDEAQFFRSISDRIPKEPPSLLHGDLWSGNYMVSHHGEPALIDPAVAYGPREMDLAMMQLFGGFPSQVFTSYNSQFPLQENWKDRIPLWQLYYLLVHLNLFGSSYLSQVKSILKRYS